MDCVEYHREGLNNSTDDFLIQFQLDVPMINSKLIICPHLLHRRASPPAAWFFSSSKFCYIGKMIIMSRF